MGSQISVRIFGVRKFFIFTVSNRTRMSVPGKSKVFFSQFKKLVNSFYDDLFKGLIMSIHK